MNIIGLILAWIFGLVLAILSLSMVLTGNYGRFAILFLAVLLLLPPVQGALAALVGWTIPPLVRIIGALVLVGLFGFLMSREKKSSIYFSPQVEAEMMAIYDQKLAGWPVPFERRFLETSYGKVFVTVSGPEDGLPVLLLNAGQMAGWSWISNVAALSQYFRAYTIDTIGEPGKSQLRDISHFPRDGKQWSDLLVEITDQLGTEKAHLVGASNGGFLALNYGIHHPERIRKMVLLGAMGLTPSTNENIFRITISQMFPLRFIQDSTIQWSFGDDPVLRAQIDPWFRLVFQTAPQQAPPSTMSPAELARVDVPTLAVLGSQDNLMGNLAAVRELAGHVPGIRLAEIDSGHLMGLEKPEECNQLILDFFLASG